jgi:hypothetical protein
VHTLMMDGTYSYYLCIFYIQSRCTIFGPHIDDGVCRKYINNTSMYRPSIINVWTKYGAPRLYVENLHTRIIYVFSTYNLGPPYLVHTLMMDGTYSYYLCIFYMQSRCTIFGAHIVPSIINVCTKYGGPRLYVENT